jgi:hypothetical protein
MSNGFQVDPSGPLATLRKLLLSDESIASFKRWVTDHWYAVVIIVFAALFILVSSVISRLSIIEKPILLLLLDYWQLFSHITVECQCVIGIDYSSKMGI